MKMNCTFFLFMFLIWLQVCLGQHQQVFFNKVLPPEGKKFGAVIGIAQDKLGYMWFATFNGLYQYDGYQWIHHYKNDPKNPASLAGNRLECVLSDADGKIWIGTFGEGLDRLDPSTGIFTHFRRNAKDEASLTNNTVLNILKDRQGTLWIGTYGGLNRFDYSTGTFIHYRHRGNDPSSLSYDEVRALYEDRQGTLWVGTGSPYLHDGGGPEDGGLNRFDRKTGKFTRYLHDPRNPHSLVDNKVRSIFEDSKGNFWVGTAGDGLHIMDRVRGTFQRYPYDQAHPEKLSRPPLKSEIDWITFIQEDATGAIWIGTNQSGINYYDPNTKKITHYESQKDTAGAFPDGGAWWAYTSREGVLWIGNEKGNLYRIDPFQRPIPHYAYPGSVIESFFEESAGILWIGTEEGLFRKDLTKGNIKRYVHDPHNPASLGNNSIPNILKDRQGNLWLATHVGLDLLNKDKETFTHYRHDPKNSHSLSSDGLGFIYEDPEANLWIGTSRGLNMMNRKTGTFTPYFFDLKDSLFIGTNNISYLLNDKRGKFWVGSWKGLHMLNPKDRKFKDYLKGKSIYSLCEDAQGSLWVGTNDGLYLYNRTSDVFTRFVVPGSLTDITEVISIAEDNQGNLWICFTDGLIKLNPQRTNIILYGSSYGVKDLEFTYCHRGPTGRLYFSNGRGFFAFYPEQLRQNPNPRPPELVLTSFTLANKVVNPSKQGPLSEPLPQAKEIRLNYNQNVFSFDFAAFDYSRPERNRSYFMLETYDKDWRAAGVGERAYYINVLPGKYTFRVKAVNSYGIWTEKSIAVIISPPWWRTGWAYLMYGILVVASIWAFIYYRSRNLLRQKRLLEKQVAARTAEVVRQKEELQKTLEELKSAQAQLIQQEKMASLGELTAGIAHEIQNPLNFVNNFSDLNTELLTELRTEGLKPNAERDESLEADIINDVIVNEQKINHHGKRADAIVKGMLQHSRASTGKKEPTNINALADEYLRLAYQGQRAKDKSFNVTMKTDFDESIGNINIIPQDIGRVVLNLINNAFYAVNEKRKQQGEVYEPTISLSTKKLNNKSDSYRIEISVKDNGNGISQKVVDKIFQPFFTTKPTGLGTGLGLSLAYDIVKAHGGEITVETKNEEGSTFIIQLPA